MSLVLCPSRCAYIFMRAVVKVMPPVSLCWPTMSEVNVGHVVVEVKPSCQYSQDHNIRNWKGP